MDLIVSNNSIYLNWLFLFNEMIIIKKIHRKVIEKQSLSKLTVLPTENSVGIVM